MALVCTLVSPLLLLKSSRKAFICFMARPMRSPRQLCIARGSRSAFIITKTRHRAAARLAATNSHEQSPNRQPRPSIGAGCVIENGIAEAPATISRNKIPAVESMLKVERQAEKRKMKAANAAAASTQRRAANARRSAQRHTSKRSCQLRGACTRKTTTVSK